MSLLELVLKQMRQRALSTWLTLLSVLLGVGLATAVLILYRGGNSFFGQTEFGYDILIGPPKGSALQLVINTVYQIDESAGVVPYQVYEDLMTKYRRNVRIAVPYLVGDTYKDHRIVGTLPKLFGFDDEGKALPPDRTLEYKIDRPYALAQGKVFHARKFEAVIGSDVTERTGLKLGDTFQATHGQPSPNQTPDVHAEKWSVVGVLQATGTAADRVIFISLISSYCIVEHGDALDQQAAMRAGIVPKPATKKADDHNHDEHAHHEHEGHEGHDHRHFDLREDGTIELKIPKDQWLLSAILVRSRGATDTAGLMYNFKVIDNRAIAVNPASVMREFFNTFFRGTTLLLLMIALLVSIVASVGILVSIYNSVTARYREIAILRALGATRARILLIICAEAVLIGLVGGVLGIIVGHLLGGVGSYYMHQTIGQGIDWWKIGWQELLYLGVVVLIALLAGLVPALKAYRVPVASNLVSG